MDKLTNLSRAAEMVFSLGNFMFLGFLVLGFAGAWLLSILFAVVERYLETRWPPSKKILDVVTQPILMLILVTAYAIGSAFLTLPGAWLDSFSGAGQYLTYLTFSWFAVNLVAVLLARLTVKGARFLRLALFVVLIVLFSLLFLANWPALIAGVILAALFYILVYRISSLPSPGFVQLAGEHKPYPRLIQVHLYLGLKTTGDNIEQAIALIKEAITTVNGTGAEKSAIFSGFAPTGLDIMIKYYIVDLAHLDQVKNDVNLTIVKKLNAAGIELGAVG